MFIYILIFIYMFIYIYIYLYMNICMYVYIYIVLLLSSNCFLENLLFETCRSQSVRLRPISPKLGPSHQNISVDEQTGKRSLCVVSVTRLLLLPSDHAVPVPEWPDGVPPGQHAPVPGKRPRRHQPGPSASARRRLHPDGEWARRDDAPPPRAELAARGQPPQPAGEQHLTTSTTVCTHTRPHTHLCWGEEWGCVRGAGGGVQTH